MNGTHRPRVLRSVLTGLFALLACAGALRPAQAQSPDPTTTGSYAVTQEEYNFGDTYATSPGFPYTKITNFPTSDPKDQANSPVEFNGVVFYPSTATGSGIVAAGKFPLIVFLHGRHSTSYDPTDPTGQTTFLEWPPAKGHLTIPSYEGYNYIAQVLASRGYVVVSIGANGINAEDNMAQDLGMLARAQILQAHLDFWKQLSTTGQATPDAAGASFAAKFVGKVDMTKIGTMGHSRGGEGVIRHYVFNADTVNNPEAKAAGGPAYPIKAVLPLAPVDFNRFVANNVPMAVILPYCDGDVSDLEGIHFFEDARYNVPADPTPKFFWTAMGADHDLFNTIWTPGVFAGGVDDWTYTPEAVNDPYAGAAVPGNHRLTPAQQEAVGLTYMTAFFRTYLGGETQFLPFLKGQAPPPASAMGAALFETYHAPDAPGARLDVNRFASPSELTVNTLGGAVSQGGLSPYDTAGGAPPEPLLPLPGQSGYRQPSNGTGFRTSTLPNLSQVRLGWSAPGAFLENDLPPGGRNVGGYAALRFRTGVNFTDIRNTVLQDDFSVTLTDGAGHTASTPVGLWSPALMYPPGRYAYIPKVMLNAVNIPLTAFGGVDLSDVRSVRLVFDRQPKGAILLADLAFVN